jgi:hypothetical protein
MCEHHACFHESVPSRASGVHRGEASNSLRSSKYPGGAPSSVSNVSLSQISGCQISQHLQASAPNEIHTPGGQGKQTTQSQAEKHLTECILSDTAQSDRQVAPGSTTQGLPPIPSQCNLPSDISSGSINGNSQSFQSFPKVGNYSSVITSVEHDEGHTVRNDQSLALTLLPVESDQQFMYGAGQGESFIQSATDVVTPSPRASPILGSDSRFFKNIESIQAAVNILASKDSRKLLDESQGKDGDASTSHPLPSTTAVAIRPASEPNSSQSAESNDLAALSVHQLLPNLQGILTHVTAHPTLSTKVSNHEQRLDLLENVSSSYMGAQEVYERFDLVDERMGEVETRVEELEKSQAAFNDMTSGSFRRRFRHLDDGSDSIVSQTSSDMISAAIDRTEIFARLETMESQLTQLQPSYAHPWTAEVVFLPFGEDLKGIWSTIDTFPSQRSKHNSAAADHRTQTQYSASAGGQALLHGNGSRQQSWEDTRQPSGRMDEMLVGRACGHNSKVEERLRSRGLVKMIEVKGPHARDVHAAMLAAFGGLPEIFSTQSNGKDQLIPDSFAGFSGLQAPWIPLRKLHKDSRLQFLDPSEMVTPALWTVSFLSGVAMRATGIKRLYVTQRESYIQQPHGLNTQWTWQKLRVLPRVFDDFNSSGEVGEADAMEACWEWDGRLDPVQSAHSSFTSQHSSLSIRQAPSYRAQYSRSRQSSSPAISPVLSTTPTSVTHTRPISPLIERFRPIHSRTNSLPSMVPTKFSPPQAKRRMASFDHSGPTSPQSSPIRQVANANTKRRRMTRSPSRPRDFYSYQEIVEHKRGTTPFAYATPHSNAPYAEYPRHQSVAGMTMDDTDELGSTTDVDDIDAGEQDIDDSDVDQEHQAEDVPWEGVEDEMLDDDSDQERKALSMDEDDDDAESDLSSQPSEYPSTQPGARYSDNKGVFHIHTDED